MRPSLPWSATIHKLLAHLQSVCGPVVPVPLSLDGELEQVGLVEGDAGGRCWPFQATDAGLASAARLLRVRRVAMADELDTMAALIDKTAAAGVPEIFRLDGGMRVATLTAQLAWLDDLINRIDCNDIAWLDEVLADKNFTTDWTELIP